MDYMPKSCVGKIPTHFNSDKYNHMFSTVFKYLIVYVLCLIILNWILMASTDSFNKTSDKSDDYKYGWNFNTLIDSIYFTFTTLTSVGYGDISPNTNFTKFVVSMEQLGMLFITFSVSQQQQMKDISETLHNFTPEQEKSLIKTIDLLKLKHDVTPTEVMKTVFEARDKFLIPLHRPETEFTKSRKFTNIISNASSMFKNRNSIRPSSI
jgi:hypothetical protein